MNDGLVIAGKRLQVITADVESVVDMENEFGVADLPALI